MRGRLAGLGPALLLAALGCRHSAAPVGPALPEPAALAPQPLAARRAPGTARRDPTPARAALLSLEVSPPDAVLELNGVEVGPVHEAAAREALGALPRGIQRIALRRQGCASWRGEVALGGAPQTLEVHLAPTSPPSPEP